MKLKELDHLVRKDLGRCYGCKRILVFRKTDDKSITWECVYTISGIKTFRTCPCWDCILKTLCSDKCDLLKDCIKNHTINP